MLLYFALHRPYPETTVPRRATAMPRERLPRPLSCPLVEDPSAVGQWTACCGRYFRPLAERAAEDPALAEDALQESWRKVLAGIAAFQGGPTACRWVRRIVARSAIDIRRRTRRRREVRLEEARGETDPGADPEVQASDRELLRALRETVALLPEPYRQVIELRFGRELSTAETAARLAVSRSNAATRLDRALRLLRKRFAARTRQARRAA